ncbi:40s ribosomal protein s11 [Lynx pardinus]|uniref:Small ribosomal subunit protein uS17 n=1 Tax=Lynx pardinus TaxID=191816 RepID=A0A485P8Z9_LYNPA|nr:40s ribosomal protein s11 [Lynx pardinus]
MADVQTECAYQKQPTTFQNKKRYNRFEKHHRIMSVHLSPCFEDIQIGDIVTAGEYRPLSKTVHFIVLKVTKAAGTKKQFQKF